MKKILLPLFLFAQLLGYSQSQNESIHFKFEYKPETKYIQEVEQVIEYAMYYTGSEEVIQGLESEGFENPMTQKNHSRVIVTVKTGKAQGESIPLTMEISESENSIEQGIIPKGTLMHGHVSTNEPLVLDSISSNELDEEYKDIFIQNFQNLFSQVVYPDKNMKIGESFSIETPVSLPLLEEMSLDITMITHYTLKSIAGNIAHFDMAVEYTMNTTDISLPIEAVGTGKGEMQHDIIHNHTLLSDLFIEMNMKMELEDIGFNVTGKSRSITTSKIVKE